MIDEVLRVAFFVETHHGHEALYNNLRRAVVGDDRLECNWFAMRWERRGILESIPPLRNNWSMRASWRARSVLQATDGRRRYGALFFHTQLIALMATSVMARVPAVVSLDATPLNYDEVGVAYGHRRGTWVSERLKWAVNKRSLHSARVLVTWSDQARRSLISDYAIDDERITVIPPGVDLGRFRPHPRHETSGPPRILFVGADFERKGGPELMEAVRHLGVPYRLDIVTPESVLALDPAIRVHRDLTNLDPRLGELYANADLFVLPTRGDCFPVAVQEAMAAGLPVIATDVGAMKEAVVDGETGYVIPPANQRALQLALRDLLTDRDRRCSMGSRARAVAESRFDARRNSQRLLDLIRSVARPKTPEMIP